MYSTVATIHTCICTTSQYTYSGIGICAQYDHVGIATAILTFFVINIIVYLAIYCVIKVS